MIRVLVVDDDPQILRALRISLHARQYDVVTAGTGRAALDAAADAHLDLVVLDLGLPDMAGVDVIRSLRTWTQVPIVILSGWMNSAAKVDALDAGADDCVTKPFSVEELLARIRAVAPTHHGARAGRTGPARTVDGRPQRPRDLRDPRGQCRRQRCPTRSEDAHWRIEVPKCISRRPSGSSSMHSYGIPDDL